MTPGQHVVLVGTELDALGARTAGLQLRDTLLILLPGPTTLFAYLFRQPLEGTVAENVLKYGTGGLNIDGCRISTTESLNGGAYCGERREKTTEWQNADRSGGKGSGFRQGIGEFRPPSGRWPTNLLLVHGPGCVRLGSKRVQGASPIHRKSEVVSDSGTHPGWRRPGGSINTRHSKGYAEEDGTESVPNWQCQPDCPVKLLDEQSGMRPGMPLQQNRNPDPSKRGWSGGWADSSPDFPGYGDSGGASRFYPQFTNFPEALDWLAKLIGHERPR